MRIMQTFGRCFSFIAVVAGAGWLSQSPLQAQAAPTPAGAATTNVLGHVERAAQLFGRPLTGSDRQAAGKLDDLVVDLESERILYGIVDGKGGKVVVPAQIFGGTANNEVQLTAPAQKIASAPRFTAGGDNAAQLGQASLVAQAYQHFGLTPWWQGSSPASAGAFHNVHRLSRLIGSSVVNVNNQPIGKVSNVVVDTPTSRLMYVVLTPDPSLKLGNNLYALPSDTLTQTAGKRSLTVNLDAAKLASAPHFDNGSWPNLSDVGFATRVYQFYGKQAWFQRAGGPMQPTGR
jgi:sporulation protein YlmC with PRC-barrel domain